MEEYGFKIKVSDLLLNPGSKDDITFEKKFIKEVEGINEDGINGNVFLQSLDKNTVYVEIKNLKATMQDTCDICGDNYEREIFVKNIQTKFVHKDKLLNPEEEIRDEEFIINPKDETIDLGEFIFQTIIEQSPIVKKCETCQHEENEADSDDEEPATNTASKIKWL